ncbi:DUF922 domain-containing Zn-dependent protease [Mesorhizobium sp. ASY16-5R]|uniref:DUF922 domain-containing Zn-dependent protease n=1 Tax=Mesorhizobium sp. ASY16-5R TaxID=3445772 RepID=UPI003FA0DC70
MLKRILALVAALAFTVPAAGAATVSKTYSYFSIGGGTLDEIEAELGKYGPHVESSGQRHPGATQMKFSMRASYGDDGKRCRIVKGDVSIKATVILPKWRRPKRADSDVRLIWDTLRSDIKRHEESHVIIAKNHARELEQALPSISAPTCKEAAEDAKAMMAKVLAKLEKAQNDFDKVEAINFERRLIRLLVYRLQRIEAYQKARKQ